MSFGILQAAFLRLAEEGRSVPGNFATTLVQFSNELVRVPAGAARDRHLPAPADRDRRRLPAAAGRPRRRVRVACPPWPWPTPGRCWTGSPRRCSSPTSTGRWSAGTGRCWPTWTAGPPWSRPRRWSPPTGPGWRWCWSRAARPSSSGRRAAWSGPATPSPSWARCWSGAGRSSCSLGRGPPRPGRLPGRGPGALGRPGRGAGGLRRPDRAPHPLAPRPPGHLPAPRPGRPRPPPTPCWPAAGWAGRGCSTTAACAAPTRTSDRARPTPTTCSRLGSARPAPPPPTWPAAASTRPAPPPSATARPTSSSRAWSGPCSWSPTAPGRPPTATPPPR